MQRTLARACSTEILSEEAAASFASDTLRGLWTLTRVTKLRVPTPRCHSATSNAITRSSPSIGGCPVRLQSFYQAIALALLSFREAVNIPFILITTSARAIGQHQGPVVTSVAVHAIAVATLRGLWTLTRVTKLRAPTFRSTPRFHFATSKRNTRSSPSICGCSVRLQSFHQATALARGSFLKRCAFPASRSQGEDDV